MNEQEKSGQEQMGHERPKEGLDLQSAEGAISPQKLEADDDSLLICWNCSGKNYYSTNWDYLICWNCFMTNWIES